MNILLRYSALLLLLTSMINGFSQGQGMHLHGRTFELNLLDSSESKVGEIPLEVFLDGSLFLEITSGKSGKYNCFLPFGEVYFVHYGKAPFVEKIIEFDLTNVGGKTERSGFSLDLDMAIFQTEDAVIKLLHQEPVAKGAYSKRDDLIVFDSKYSQQHGNQVRRLIQAWRENQK